MAPPGDVEATPPEQPALQDELLEEILLRLTEAADLARASTACPTLRRVITAHSFLRRFRTLHPPPLLGIISATFRPAQHPHPSAAAARAFAAAEVDFWCSFLPSVEQRWRHRDFRDGRALFSGIPEGSSYAPGDYDPRDFVGEFVVCDPLYRRYRLLPPISDELAVLVHQPDIVNFEPFLAPPGDVEDPTSFRVMCLAQCTTKLVLFVFSSGAGEWHAVTFDGWIALVTSPGNQVPDAHLTWASERYYVHKCFCWAVSPSNKLLMLDTRTMEFSAVDLPRQHVPGQMIPMMAFVEAGEGRLGMFTLMNRIDNDRYFLRYTKLQKDGDGANKWHPVAIISLPLGYRYTIMDVAGGYLLLQGIPENLHSAPLPERPDLDCFSLNLQTLQLEWFCANKYMIGGAPLYAGFPPSLTPPTV
ncbi:uncharacterized protein LOC119325478 [Triticum dicoccoides]|uniref:uncharacterized protein LOC119325478 n=1 Tax=Triticum dicoccoides TaxID=85692 RepID=UPI000E78BE32|nr:uncharacterized protein LOC119325478 [Triticum dicoccoides]XP_037455120.1 uncharacterized protein LOC119325478 [Triticum dicoccoides]